MRHASDNRLTIAWLAIATCLSLNGGVAEADFAFGNPVNLGPQVNSSFREWNECMSSDGLELYIGGTRPSGMGGKDLWVCTRPTSADSWSAPTHLGPRVNSNKADEGASISPDGLQLYFSSKERSGGRGGWDIWVARRQSRDALWELPVNLGTPINDAGHQMYPWVSDDGLELYFNVYSANADIYVSKRATQSDPWGAPEKLGPHVNSPLHEFAPALSSDGLLMLFDEYKGSVRPGGFGGVDMWYLRRPSLADPWGTPSNLGPINSPFTAWNPRISPDGRTLYFSSNRAGGYGDFDLWQAPITPIVDFTGDGVVDGREILTLTQSWGTDDPSCDVGPMPWGDGIVDIEDLRVLAGYIGKDVVDGSLIAHWAFDETNGDVAYDSSYENDGLIMGGAVWQPEDGPIEGAVELNGIDGYIDTPLVVNPAMGPFSVLAWVRGGGPKQAIISQADGSDWLRGSVAGRDGVGGKLATTLGPMALTSSVVVADGQWHRVGLVYDGTQRILYVDGVAVAEDTVENMPENRGVLYIGCGADQSPESFFAGLIDDVRLYNRAVRP